MIAWVSALLIAATVFLTSLPVVAQEGRSRSILVLDQSDLRGPFYHSVFSGLRSAFSSGGRSHITLYAESPDLSRFRGTNYEALLQQYLKEKYRDVPIGAVVAIGAATLELVLPWRSELGPVQASARNVALHFESARAPIQVRGDQLQQVIMNLVVNSMDAMAALPNGRAVIGRTEINGGLSAVISISDSGPGVPAEKLSEVFDPFFTTKRQGMGIGLSISRTIVQAHNGRIWAENQKEGGAVFRLSLPIS